jgi:hypothetical protein
MRDIVIGHEAGHAVVARHYGVRVKKIIIETGEIEWGPETVFPSLFDNVVYLMAGQQAEWLFLNQESAGARIDNEQAAGLIACGLDTADAIIAQAKCAAHRILSDESGTWHRLVGQLTAGEMDLSWFNRGIHCDET